MFTDLDQYTPEERGLITDDTFWFEVPDRMSKDIKFYPSPSELEIMLEDVPVIIVTSVIEAMEQECTIDPFNTLYYLFRGWLAPFVVVYFLRRQNGSRAAMKTKFFKALHYIEALRERVYHPEWYRHDTNQYAKYSSKSRNYPNLEDEPAKTTPENDKATKNENDKLPQEKHKGKFPPKSPGADEQSDAWEWKKKKKAKSPSKITSSLLAEYARRSLLSQQ